MAFSATALAQSPTDEQYGGTINRGGDPGDPSELAFTGLDVVTFAVIGLVLIGVGLAARRLTRERRDVA